MALTKHTPTLLPENQVTSIAPSDKLFTHAMQVSAGDKLVLFTKGQLRPHLIDIFSVMQIEHSPDLRWSVIDLQGRKVEQKEAPIVFSKVSLRIPVPILIDRTARGYKTLIEVTIPDNYSLYDHTFLRGKMKKLYKELKIDQYI